MANNCSHTTVDDDDQHVWVETMFWCLEDQDDSKTKLKSVPPLRVLNSGRLQQSNINQIPTDVMMHTFTFLNILDYFCNVSLVCKEWTLNLHDIIENSFKFKVLKEIMYHSFKLELKEKYYLSNINCTSTSILSMNDLLFEMEVSIAFALLKTPPIYNIAEDNDVCNFARFPPQPLFFSVNKDYRRFSYVYLLHYIHLYKFGPRNLHNLGRMYVLLSRLIFVGSTLCIGFMMELFYDKYGNKDTYNGAFWDYFGLMYSKLYITHGEHFQHKPMYVLEETIYSFIKIIVEYCKKWNHDHKSGWPLWPITHAHNLLNPIVIKATEIFDE